MATQTGAANSIIDYAVAGVGGTTLLLIILAVMVVNYKSKRLDLEADISREQTFIWAMFFCSIHGLPSASADVLLQHLSRASRLGPSVPRA